MEYKYTAEGQRVRVSTRTGQAIPKPVEAMQRKDVKVRSGYVGMLQTSVCLKYHVIDCR